MFKTLGGLFKGQSQDKLIKKYTKDLAEITSRIHYLEQGLKKNQSVLNQWQRQLNFYGPSTLLLLSSAVYMAYTRHNRLTLVLYLAVSIVVFILLKILLNKWFAFRAQRSMRKLDQLRASHQEKLETLKKETNFYSTNSLIQRFSSGETQSEDAMTLMDEELNSKYKELQDLQKELHTLREDESNGLHKNEEREKWFDKVLGVLSGGDLNLDNQLKPIVCSQCGQHTGSFMVVNKPLKYVCPLCNWTYDSDEKREEEVTEEVNKKLK